MRRGLLHRLAPFLGLLVFALALWLLHHELKTLHYCDIADQLRKLPSARLGIALLLTVLGYLVLTGYDMLGMKYIGQTLSLRSVMFASFLSYTFSNNVGLSIVGASTVRLRMYTAWGISPVDVVRLIAFTSTGFWVGVHALAGVVLTVQPLCLPDSWHVPLGSVRPLGVVLLGIVAAYLALCAKRRRPLRVRSWEFPLPAVRLALAQTAVGLLDWTLAATTLYVLLPASTELAFPVFLGAYLLAQVVGLASHVPGGLGVFETTFLMLLKTNTPTGSLVAALLAYRLIYYLLPLAVGVLMMGGYELRQHRLLLRRVGQAYDRRIRVLVPHVFAFTTFAAGAILLLSGATPALTGRLQWLADFVPLPAIELSHLLGSLAGTGLILLGRGLQRRINAAYWTTLLLLIVGIVASLLKGLDYEEALILAAMALALVPCREQFYRQASLLDERFTPGWVASIAMVLIGSIWLGVFAHKHVEYTNDLWWQFGLFAHAPRFLRASLATVTAVVVIAAARLIRPAAPLPVRPDPPALARVDSIVRQSPRTQAYLALLGDKQLLFNEQQNAFIMYGVHGRSWVALGDPVGPDDQQVELVWRFRALCDRYAGRCAFYQVEADRLPQYIDLGLAPLKLGEEARVRLDTFTLEGGARKSLRHEVRRGETEGFLFEIVPPDSAAKLLGEFRRISDGWLASKQNKERSFSIGFFNEDYLRRFPAAIVRVGDSIVAFANIWPGADHNELSLDLMRYVSGGPRGAMTYLFVQLMLWGKQEGYAWFNLGMAPLSGLQDRALSPLWNRVGAWFYRHGEHFYNFEGVRQYKEKFDPLWSPKYLASPGGLDLPGVLADLAALIASTPPKGRPQEKT
ncbi:MAG TPA: bifunctional lysylphosphatidylglycerol flippase/synthetase MprF [Phycisphaerae bacterium]|nr:bifunctional lysylphosphatidylglycerol flippase/synthetase MprF [Phycisphaerae bacterium]